MHDEDAANRPESGCHAPRVETWLQTLFLAPRHYSRLADIKYIYTAITADTLKRKESEMIHDPDAEF